MHTVILCLRESASVGALNMVRVRDLLFTLGTSVPVQELARGRMTFLTFLVPLLANPDDEIFMVGICLLKVLKMKTLWFEFKMHH